MGEIHDRAVASPKREHKTWVKRITCIKQGLAHKVVHFGPLTDVSISKRGVEKSMAFSLP